MKRRGFFATLLAPLVARLLPRSDSDFAGHVRLPHVRINGLAGLVDDGTEQGMIHGLMTFVDTRTGREVTPDGKVVNPGNAPQGRILADGRLIGGWVRQSYPDINARS